MLWMCNEMVTWPKRIKLLVNSILITCPYLYLYMTTHQMNTNPIQQIVQGKRGKGVPFHGNFTFFLHQELLQF